jgi:hypothetical protein
VLTGRTLAKSMDWVAGTRVFCWCAFAAFVIRARSRLCSSAVLRMQSRATLRTEERFDFTVEKVQNRSGSETLAAKAADMCGRRRGRLTAPPCRALKLRESSPHRN